MTTPSGVRRLKVEAIMTEWPDGSCTTEYRAGGEGPSMRAVDRLRFEGVLGMIRTGKEIMEC
ncbi:MAG: hypothetical protein CV089_02345 [Nitrospira sp. WS110]|nr:hypothetical protein [Nitrospira sp. WS110]